MSTEVIIANYLDRIQADDIVYLLNCYAEEPMGGGQPLSEYARANLAPELAQIPYAFSVLCYVDGKPAGLANCFEGFSTFKCKPLINIHDLMVESDYRGKGISQKLLQKVEEIATSKGCCKITLEVLAGNSIAQNAYLKYGFEPYKLNKEDGNAEFWQKPF